MAAVLPVICSDIRGNKCDLIQQDRGWYFVDATDAAGFAQAISKIITEDNVKKGNLNAENVSKYDIVSVKEMLLHLIQDALNDLAVKTNRNFV